MALFLGRGASLFCFHQPVVAAIDLLWKSLPQSSTDVGIGIIFPAEPYYDVLTSFGSFATFVGVRRGLEKIMSHM